MPAHTRPIDRWTDELLEKAIRGHTTIYRGDHAAPYRLTAEERRQLESAKERHFVVAGRRVNLRNAFFVWCELHQQPYIVVEKRRNYATVSMDLIALEANKLHPEATREVEQLLIEKSARNAWVSVGTYSSSDKVPLDQADEVAAKLYAIFTAPRTLDGDQNAAN